MRNDGLRPDPGRRRRQPEVRKSEAEHLRFLARLIARELVQGEQAARAAAAGPTEPETNVKKETRK